MVVVPKSWLSELRAKISIQQRDGLNQEVVGVLAFEAAATMARLISLHRALSEQGILRLRSDTMRSQGVSYLNSTDQAFLFRLACAELMVDLDRTADGISRLDRKCHAPLAKRFSRVYAQLKNGNADQEQLGPCMSQQRAEKKVRKMAKYVTATSKLCSEMEVLETSRQKLNNQWNRYSGPIPTQQKPGNTTKSLLVELEAQHQKVHKLKEECLWNQTFDKVVRIMVPVAIFIFTRICAVFGPFVPGLPPVVTSHGTNSSIWFAPVSKLRVHPRLSSSGPMDKRAAKEVPIRSSCPILFGSKETQPSGNWSKLLEAPPNTVGGSGMTMRYADVVVSAEKLLLMKSSNDELATEKDKNQNKEMVVREELYQMLPGTIRRAVRRKLRECWREAGPEDEVLADGWREAVERILEWLGPMAHDTLRWQGERNMDRRQWFDPQPKALLMQTLHFSDMEKTEAAIVEVLVGLSCVCWYHERSFGSLRF